MRVAVTGAGGFIGRHLVPRLAEEHEVVALVRTIPEQHLGSAKTIVIDLTSPSMEARLPTDIDVIVHLAQAYKSFPDFAAEIFSVNATSTQRLADLARAVGVRRFVLASTGSIYGLAGEALRESDRPRPMGFPAAAKLIAEQVLSYYADPLEIVSLRLFAPYGPGQVDRLIPRLIAAVKSGSAVTLSRGGEPRMNPIYIDDLVKVFQQAVVGRGDGVINVAGPAVVSIKEMADIIGEAIGRVPVYEHRDHGPTGDLVADTGRMHEAFSLDGLVEPRDGLQRMVAASAPAP